MKEKDGHYMRIYNKVMHKDNLVGQKKIKKHRLFTHTHTQRVLNTRSCFPRCCVSVFGLQAPGLSVRRVITALCVFMCVRVWYAG